MSEYKTRLCEITLTDEFRNVNANNDRNVRLAIGYLSTWASNGDTDRYSGKVSIWGDEEGCISATYRNSAGEPSYGIYAVLRRDGTFSFHS